VAAVVLALGASIAWGCSDFLAGLKTRGSPCSGCYGALVLGSLYPLATVVLARAVLHEEVTGSQRTGVAAALAGIGLVSLA
jgi:hypothetical protein